MLPYQLFANRDQPDPMWGNAYRLSRLKERKSVKLDKVFPPQPLHSR